MSNEDENKKIMTPAEFFAQYDTRITNRSENNIQIQNDNTVQYVQYVDDNPSGKGANYPVPDDVAKRFNWGAFLLSWIWGLGNHTYITFLIFATALVSWIPIIGWLISLGVCIWFGKKGNTWAWQNKHFDSIEAFHNYQKKWAVGGVIVALIFSVIIPIIIIFSATLPLFFGSSHYSPKDYETKLEQVNEDISKYQKDSEDRMAEINAELEKIEKLKQEMNN